MNLILKDFVLVKNKMLAYSLLCISLILLFKLTVHNAMIENVLVCVVGVLFSYFNTIITFEAEGKYKAEATIVTLPYRRRDIIAAKYGGILLSSLIFYCVITFFIAGLNFMKIGALSGIGILYGVAGSLIVYAFMIPFFVQFEYTKAANVMMLLFMLIGVLAALFLKSMPDMIQAILIYKQINYYNIFIISVILLLISYIISSNIYEKKEFR